MDPHINPSSGVWDDNYFANNHPTGGGGAPSIPNDTASYDKLLSGLPKAADFASGLDATTNGAFSNYLKYMQGQQSPLDFYSAISKSQGIPAMQDTAKSLQSQIYQTEDALGRIPENVTATTGNSLVTQAQREGIINAKSQPLQDTLTKQSTAYGRVSDALTKANEQAMNLTNLNEQGISRMGDVYKTGISVTQDNAARSMTGFTTDLQNTLNVNLQKIARGEAISDEEAKMAFDALQKEKDYQNQLSLAKEKNQGSNVLSVGEGSALFDPSTGAVLYKNPKTSSAGSSSDWG